MKYAQHIATLAEKLKDTPESVYMHDKREAKRLIESIGIRCPKDFAKLPYNFVLKSHTPHGPVNFMHGDQSLNNAPPYTILEEMIRDELGFSPARKFRWYIFGTPKLVEVQHKQTRGYYTALEWNPSKIDRKFPWYDAARPFCFEKMSEAVERISKLFDFPFCVDMFASSSGPVFSKFSSMPDLAARLTTAGDILFASWWREFADFPRKVEAAG